MSAENLGSTKVTQSAQCLAATQTAILVDCGALLLMPIAPDKVGGIAASKVLRLLGLGMVHLLLHQTEIRLQDVHAASLGHTKNIPHVT